MINEIKLKDFLDQFRKSLPASEFRKLRKILKSGNQKDISVQKTSSEEYIPTVNFRIILDLTLFSLEKSLSIEKYSEVILSLTKFFLINGHYNFAFHLTNTLSYIAKKNGQLANYYGYGLLNIAEIYRRQALWNEGLKRLNEARKLFMHSNDFTGIARCENLSGSIYAEQGNIKKAQNYFFKGLEIVENSNQLIAGLIHNNLGIVNSMIGNFELALSYFQRALVVFEKYNSKYYVADVRHNIGMIYIRKEKFKKAINEFDRCIHAAQLTNYQNILALSFLSKSYLFILMNDIELAEVWLDKSLEIADGINDNLTIADCYKVKGIILKKKKNYDEAEIYFLRSLQLNKRYNNQLNYAESCTELGLLLKEKNNLVGAKKYFMQALRYYKKINSKIDSDRIKSYL